MMKHDLPSGQTILIPPGLCEDGQELFRILAEQIDADGRLRGDDWLALGQLAQLQIDIANLQADIRVNGLTEDTDRNQCQRRIEVSTLNQMRGHFRSLLAERLSLRDADLTPLPLHPKIRHGARRPRKRLFAQSRHY